MTANEEDPAEVVVEISLETTIPKATCVALYGRAGARCDTGVLGRRISNGGQRARPQSVGSENNRLLVIDGIVV